MVLIVQLNQELSEVHDVRELHVYFNRNIMQLVYDNEQDAISEVELSEIGFPSNALVLSIREND